MKTSQLASRLKQGRKKSLMQQEFVAKAMGLPRTAIAAIELGNREVTALELRDFCRLYHVEPNEILMWKVLEEE